MSIPTLPECLFYFFAGLCLLSASMVVIARNPVRAVLFLVLTFFSMGGLWILLEAEFLAMTLVLVYVGAVMVLFLFVVMMLDIDLATLRSRFIHHLPLAFSVSVLVVLGLVTAIVNGHWAEGTRILPVSHPSTYSEVKHLGELLYSYYLFPFELAGILLLVAIVAAISLTFRGQRHKLTQKPSEQISVNKESRLRIVSMPGHQGSKP